MKGIWRYRFCCAKPYRKQIVKTSCRWMRWLDVPNGYQQSNVLLVCKHNLIEEIAGSARTTLRCVACHAISAGGCVPDCVVLWIAIFTILRYHRTFCQEFFLSCTHTQPRNYIFIFMFMYIRVNRKWIGRQWLVFIFHTVFIYSESWRQWSKWSMNIQNDIKCL